MFRKWLPFTRSLSGMEITEGHVSLARDQAFLGFNINFRQLNAVRYTWIRKGHSQKGFYIDAVCVAKHLHFNIRSDLRMLSGMMVRACKRAIELCNRH